MSTATTTAPSTDPTRGASRGQRRIRRNYFDRRYTDPWSTNAVVGVIDTSYHDALKVVYSRATLTDAVRRDIAPLPPTPPPASAAPPVSDALHDLTV